MSGLVLPGGQQRVQVETMTLPLGIRTGEVDENGQPLEEVLTLRLPTELQGTTELLLDNIAKVTFFSLRELRVHRDLMGQQIQHLQQQNAALQAMLQTMLQLQQLTVEAMEANASTPTPTAKGKRNGKFEMPAKAQVHRKSPPPVTIVRPPVIRKDENQETGE